jgi:beta-glucanase (GH16 family)
MRFLLLSLACLATSVWADPTGGMKVVWTENFDGPAVDEAKWTIHNRNPGSVSIKEGKLYLAMLPGKESTYWQSTGISTVNKFTQAQGYFEASMRMLQTPGRSGRFEVRNKSLDEPPSARIFFDNWGDDNIAPGTQVADNTGIRMLRPVKHGIALDGGASYRKFHTYGIHWTAKYFALYVDGKQVHRQDIKVTPTTPMYLEFVHHTPEGGIIKSFPDPNNPPEALQIDWVKVYK